MANKDLYKILGLGKDANDKEIKKAYRKAAMKWHPDKWGYKSETEQKNAEEKFKEVTEAYEILSDKEKRSQYDLFGTTDFGGSNASNMNPDDIFAQFMSGSGFGGFGGFHQPRERVYCGTDKKIRIGVTLEDVFFERLKTVSYDVERPCEECKGVGSLSGADTSCPYCHGTGFITQTHHISGGIVQNTQSCPHCQGTGRFVKDPCHKCNGSGVVSKKVEKSFKVPKIDRLQYTYQMVGEGNSCHNNRGNNGDLYFTFALKEDPNSKFRIDETNPSNIITGIKVSVIDCLTGCTADIKTIDGKTIKLTIPQGTKDGYEFTFNNYGLHLSNGMVGKLIVRVEMEMCKLTEKQIEKIRKIVEEK